jgi:hypothetical protein
MEFEPHAPGFAPRLENTYEVSDSEDAEITRSLQASLLVQAPLQARFDPETGSQHMTVHRALPRWSLMDFRAPC